MPSNYFNCKYICIYVSTIKPSQRAYSTKKKGGETIHLIVFIIIGCCHVDIFDQKLPQVSPKNLNVFFIKK